MDGRTAFSLASATIAFVLSLYMFYLAIHSCIARHAARRDEQRSPDWPVGGTGRRVAVRLACGTAALFAILALTATNDVGRLSADSLDVAAIPSPVGVFSEHKSSAIDEEADNKTTST
ncbi:MAG: hypothetical protein AUH29_06750 [Candidatus Rokubacteria bacterium 13_1_40CM_69_27]|nr:MAG: hypothetical protein AUH29_06750 [Candidatus Rokubacteria bacterium 13_1_40CM_69_27]OLC35949.1 MAG: hypothetical protein AUH81_09065 [Candidatus Rokubacteria bacterium 13_1_40CM_4_69_5]